jgi:hypothetical protein
MLMGTSCLMSTLQVGKWQVPLGDVVRRAFSDSGLKFYAMRREAP